MKRELAVSCVLALTVLAPSLASAQDASVAADAGSARQASRKGSLMVVSGAKSRVGKITPPACRGVGIEATSAPEPGESEGSF